MYVDIVTADTVVGTVRDVRRPLPPVPPPDSHVTTPIVVEVADCTHVCQMLLAQ